MSPEGSTSHLEHTFTKIDYVTLYEKIGDIVIERAQVGNKECQNIYATAWEKTKEFHS
jgi:hypothetical protein